MSKVIHGTIVKVHAENSLPLYNLPPVIQYNFKNCFSTFIQAIALSLYICYKIDLHI